MLPTLNSDLRASSASGIIKRVDGYLAEEALLDLEGQALDPLAQKTAGLLLGHKRGPRFFVEKIFPCRAAFFSTLQNYRALDHHFGSRIIGFYSFDSNPRKKHQLCRPFACGKLYLEIRPGRKKLTMKASVIDYKDKFYFRPVPLLLPPQEKT
jgi:hypothetical protein